MPRAARDASPPTSTFPAPYFDHLYRQQRDPWGFASRWYERRKYEITIASLPRERYHRCFEPGCSIGELTKLLATRCDQVLAVGCSVEAIAQARDALRCVANVQVELAMLPAQAPQDDFDLIVLSEILYYFNKADLQVVLDQLISRLAPDGDLVAVHLRSRDQFRGTTVSTSMLLWVSVLN